MSTRTSLYALLIAVVAVTAAGCGSPSRSPGTYPPPLPRGSRLHPPLAVDASYRRAVEAGVAVKLNTTVDTLGSQLRALAGSTLENLAKPLGFAEDRLGVVTLASLDRGADAEVRSGHWTAADARKETRYWSTQSAPSLIAEVSAWFASR